MKDDAFLLHLNREDLPAIEVLIAALCYLMTQYAREPDAALVPEIRRHLRLLEQHPDCDSRLLQSMCQRLAGHWLGLARDRRPLPGDTISLIH